MLLEELRQLARKNNLPEPNAECKAGWCLQCQCSVSEIKQVFGDVEYIVTPSLPPVPGTLLPCISRRLVMTHDLKELYQLASQSSTTKCQLHRKQPIWARRSKPSEVGDVHKTQTISGVLVKESVITDSSVIIKHKPELPIGVGETLISLESFTARYGTEPGYQFAPYKDSNGAEAIEVSAQFVADLMVDGEDVYVKHNKEVFTLIPGDVITPSGSIIRKEVILKEFDLVRQVDEICQSDNGLQRFR